MRIATCHLKSITPYSQSRKHNEPKKEKETANDHEARTWMHRVHKNEDGFIFIPPMAFKWAIERAAAMLRMRIPGKGQSEYGKHFKSGILVMDQLVLPIKAKDVQGEWLFLNADGKRGSGKRVDRCMPCIPSWEGDVTFYVVDDTITEEVFEKHLKEAGSLVGIGRFRPENGGFYGRFKATSVSWSSDGEN